MEDKVLMVFTTNAPTWTALVIFATTVEARLGACRMVVVSARVLEKATMGTPFGPFSLASDSTIGAFADVRMLASTGSVGASW